MRRFKLRVSSIEVPFCAAALALLSGCPAQGWHSGTGLPACLRVARGRSAKGTEGLHSPSPAASEARGRTKAGATPEERVAQ